MTNSEIEEYMQEVEDPPSVDVPPSVEKTNDIEEKRESLAMLAVLGTTKEYTGITMSLGDVKKLSVKGVEKYFKRYQAFLGKQITGGLVEAAIQVAAQAISYIVPIDDSESLCKDLQNDELVKRELSNAAGLLVLKGGRFVALASALFQVIRHVKLRPTEHPLEQPINTLELTEQ